MKSMKLTALLLAAVTAISMTAVAVPAATDQVEAIKKAGKIQMTTNAEFEPFEYKDGDEIVCQTAPFTVNVTEEEEPEEPLSLLSTSFT